MVLRRSGRDRYLGGVAGGMAAAVDLDPVLVRVAIAVAAVVSPVAVLAYVGAWILVPEEGDDRSLLGSVRRPGGLRALGAALALGLGALVVLPDLRPGGSAGLQFGVVLIVAGVVMLSRPTPGRRSPGSAGGGWPAPGPETTVPSGPPPPEPPSPPRPSRAPRPPRAPRPRPFLAPLVVSVLVVISGVVVALDRSGTILPPGAILSLALVVVGAGLMVSVHWGRARGLILVGVALVPLWAAFSPSDIPRFPGTGSHRFTPSAVVEVAPAYTLGFGALEVDLSGMGDDFRSLTTEIGLTAGRATVVVPAEAEVVVRGRMGLGDVELWDDPERRGYRTRDTGVLANRRIARTYAPYEVSCYRVLDDGEWRRVGPDDLTAGEEVDGDGSAVPTTTVVDTSVPPPDAGGPPTEGAAEPPPASTPATTSTSTSTSTTQARSLVDELGEPCVARSPDPNPPTVTLDVTIGAGRLEVHRVPTPA